MDQDLKEKFSIFMMTAVPVWGLNHEQGLALLDDEQSAARILQAVKDGLEPVVFAVSNKLAEPRLAEIKD